MRPVSRVPVRKSASAGQFKRNVSKTKGANINVRPMRGGWRL